MSTTSSGAKGMLSKEAARKSVFANMVDLYKSDLAFRGMMDFAIIGALAMMFLDPPNKVAWPWSGGSSGLQSSTDGGLLGGGSSSGSAAQGPVAAGPVVPIPYYNSLKNPRLGLGFLFDIDDKPFQSSSAADRPRLQAARTAVALRQPDEVIEQLRQANGDDPNVALLRGAAFAIRNTEDGNRTAEALWRQAVNGGSTQAKALLGRMLVAGPPGVKANPTEGRELIEAGAAAGDPEALRFAGIGYLSGDLGVLDAAKAAELLKQGADAGDAMAMAVYSRLLADGIGVGSADGKQAEQYLRKAAKAGLTMAQLTLGDWLVNQYAEGLLPDPKEAIDWYKTAYNKGHALDGLNSLAYLQEAVAKAPPWKNAGLAMSYVRLCSGFADGLCQFNTGIGWNSGYFGEADPVRARAHVEIARTLGYQRAVDELKTLDAALTPSQMSAAETEEQRIRAALKPPPPQIPLQYEGLVEPPPPKAVIASLEGFTPQPQGSSGPSSGGGSANTVPASPEIEALRKRAEGHMAEKDYDSAIADLTDIIRKGNATWVDYNQRGMAHHSKNQLDAALEDYTRAIAHDAHAGPAYFNRALVHNEQGDTDKALADINVAIKENDSWPAYYLDRGELYFRKGNYDAAFKDYDKYVAMVQKDASATADVKANAYLMRGKARVQKGIAEGDTCKRMIPPDPACNDKMKYMSAALDFEQALLAKPDLAEAHFQLAWIADTMGNKRKAIESYTYALKADPNYSMAYNNRGVIYGDMGQRDLALADYNDAIRTAPQNQYAWANRGALFSGSRRGRKQAIADFRQALAIDPTYDYAINGLRKLGARP